MRGVIEMKVFSYLILAIGLVTTQNSMALSLKLKCDSELQNNINSESLVHWQIVRKISGDDNTGMLEISLQFGHGQPLIMFSRFMSRQVLGRPQTLVADARTVPMLQRYALTFEGDFTTGSMSLGEDVPADDKSEISMPEKMKADFMASFGISAEQADELVYALITERFKVNCFEQ
jgi:hypothetical protein